MFQIFSFFDISKIQGHGSSGTGCEELQGGPSVKGHVVELTEEELKDEDHELVQWRRDAQGQPGLFVGTSVPSFQMTLGKRDVCRIVLFV